VDWAAWPIQWSLRLRFGSPARHPGRPSSAVSLVAVTAVDALDINVLGRDITGLFSVIVDQPGDVVCLLGQRHRYTIEQL